MRPQLTSSSNTNLSWHCCDWVEYGSADTPPLFSAISTTTKIQFCRIISLLSHRQHDQQQEQFQQKKYNKQGQNQRDERDKKYEPDTND